MGNALLRYFGTKDGMPTRRQTLEAAERKLLDDGLMQYINTMLTVSEDGARLIKDTVHFNILISMLRPELDVSANVVQTLTNLAKEEGMPEVIASSGGVTAL